MESYSLYKSVAHKLINPDWIVNNLNVDNLLINYLNLEHVYIRPEVISNRFETSNRQYRVNSVKRVNTEAAAYRLSVAVLKNQEQPLVDVLQNRYY